MHPNDDFDENAMFSPNVARPQQPMGAHVHPHAMHPPGMHPGMLPLPPHQPPNPLARYYRVPGLNVSIPTKGVFLPPGGIELTAAGDVPVLPMRGGDEMLLKNPDALMSGYALEKLLESCVPSIKTPRLISTPDLDVLLLAIRVATNGDKMPLTVECPKCELESEFDCDLPALLSTMKTVDPVNPIFLSDEVTAYVRPFNLHNATVIALASFEEARRLQTLENSEADNRVKAGEMNKTLERIRRLNQEAIADAIIKITVPEGDVFDRRSIVEFMMNVPKAWSDKIEAMVADLNNRGIDKTLHVKCPGPECGHEWDTEVEFDPSNFFVAGSSK